MNYQEWSKRKFWLIMTGVFILGMVLSPKNSTKEVVKETKEVSTPTATPGATSKPIETPKPAVKPIVVSQKEYKEVFRFSGNGAKKSEPFTIRGDRFKIKYDCTGALCSATLQSPTDQFKMDLIMNIAGSTKDESIFYGSGEYYINANTMGSYILIVEDYL